MTKVTFDKFVKDYNKYYQTKEKKIRLTNKEVEEVIWDLYDTEDFEIDYDREIINLY